MRRLKPPFLHDIDACIDHQARQHDQRSEAALVESRARGGKDQKTADERDGNQPDDSQRKPQRLEEDGADEEDDND